MQVAGHLRTAWKGLVEFVPCSRTVPAPVFAICALATTALAGPVRAGSSAVINGDFESPDEAGWSYMGSGDGSHGVFSDPTRPGSHSYLLQLANGSHRGSSAISQVLSLTRSAVYRVQLDVWDCGPSPAPGFHCRHSAVLGEVTFFDREAGRPAAAGGGWTRFSALYRAEREHPALQIRLTGSGVNREASTTAIDQVSVERVDASLPLPLLPGKPLIATKDHPAVPIALGFASSAPSLLSLQEFRDLLGATPALAAVRFSWPDAAEPAFWPGLSAWVQQGVIPIVSIPCGQGDLSDFQKGTSLARWRQFAAEARRWRYPLILRLAPGMDRGLPTGQAAAFQSFWNALHGLFQEAGARNVRWFWTPSSLGDDTHSFYPGTASVDLVGFSLSEAGGEAELQRNAEFARNHYPGKGVAVAESNGLLLPPEEWRRLCPELEFFTAGSLAASLPAANSPAACQLSRALNHPPVLPAYSQIHPPSIHVRLFRDGRRITVLLRNQEPPQSSSPTTVRVSVWNGLPFQNSNLLKDFGSLTIRPQHRRTVRCALPPEALPQAFVLVDRTAAPCFMHPLPEDIDWETEPDLMLHPVPQ